jgi:hypothetical protein
MMSHAGRHSGKGMKDELPAAATCRQEGQPHEPESSDHDAARQAGEDDQRVEVQENAVDIEHYRVEHFR